MEQHGVHVTVQLPGAQADQAVRVLTAAGFLVSEAATSSSRTRASSTLVRAVLPVDGEPDRQRTVIAEAARALAAIGIESSWGSTGVGSGSISSEWLEVVDADSGQPLGVKISVANRFEVEQELNRTAAQLGTSRALLDVRPYPPWLGA